MFDMKFKLTQDWMFKIPPKYLLSEAISTEGNNSDSSFCKTLSVSSPTSLKHLRKLKGKLCHTK